MTKYIGIGLALFVGAYTESFAARGFWGIMLYIALVGFAVALTGSGIERAIRRAADKSEEEAEAKHE